MPANKLSSSHTRRQAAQSVISSGDVTFDTSTLVVDSANDRVGIGTTTPTQTLHIEALDDFEGLQVDGAKNQYTASFRSATNTGKAYGPYIRGGTNTSDSALVVDNADGTSNYFRIGGDGNIGIGTTSPSVKLHVIGGDETTAKFEDSTGKSILLDGNSVIASSEMYMKVGSGEVLYFQDGSNTNAVINGSGNLGIGTLSPDMKLHVVGGDETTAKFEDSSGKYSLIDGNSFIASSELYVKVASGQSIYFQDGSSTNAIIDSSGNLGIGTVSPDMKLHVVGGDETTAKFEDSTGKYTSVDGNSVIASSEMYVKVGSGQTLYFQDGGNTNAVIDGSGNLGIGTASPTEKLHINGDAIRIETASTVSGKTATGLAGEIRWDTGYIYVCVDTNTWKRAAIGDGGW